MFVRFTRLATLLVMLGVATVGCGKYSISNIRSLKAFQDATVLYKKSDFKGAVKLYEESIRHNPNFGFGYFFLGNSYDNMYKPARKDEPGMIDNLNKAVENYRMAIDKLANSTDEKEKDLRKRSYEYLIAAYGPDKLNDFSKAEPIAKELISMEPGEPLFHQALGNMYKEQGRYDEAEAEYKKAISVKPNDPLGYQVLAGYYNSQGEFDKTMEAFQQRANMEPNNPEAWHTMATYFSEKAMKDKNLPKAKTLDYVMRGIEADDKALALNAEYYEALTYKNILLRQQVLLEKDPAKQASLTKLADELRAKAIELQKKQGSALQAEKDKADKDKKSGGKN